MRIVRLARVAAATALAVLAACSAAPPSPTPPAAPPVIDAAALRAQEDRVMSLRVQFAATTTYEGTERSADGILIVRKPDRFRLRLLLPLGVAIFDYLNVGEQSWVTRPLAPRSAAAPPANAGPPFSREDLGQAFLRGDYAYPGSCETIDPESAEVVIACRVGGELRREIAVSRATGFIATETSYEQGAPRMIIQSSDYRPVGALWLPFHIAMSYPQQGASVDISVQSYEVNPSLSDTLFQPPAES